MAGGATFKFHGSHIEILTAFDADSPPMTITAITQANPAVVTYTGTDPQDGDVIKIEGVVGMTEVNDKVFIVANVGSGTLELWEVDSSGYEAYISGGTIALGSFSNMCELTNYNRTSGTTPENSSTTMCSTSQEFVGGLPDFGTTALAYKFAPRTAIQEALHRWFLSTENMAVRVVLPNDGGETVTIGWVQQESETAGVGTPLWDATTTIRNTGNRFDVEMID